MASLIRESVTQPRPSARLEDGARNRARKRKTHGATANQSPERINNLIEREIIPRLIAAHSIPGSTDNFEPVSQEEIDRFAPLPVTLEADELLTEVEIFLSRGVSPETIFVELLAPSARRLGELWEEDSVDFTEVTMGLWRLQEVMREIACRTPTIAGRLFSPRSVLFATMPGEQHSFGTVMVEECFSRAGWDTELVVNGDRSALADRIAEQIFDLLGLTISCDCHIGPLPKLIESLRGVSKNSDIRIMIGGRVPNEHPGLADTVGADGTASNARTAIEVADELVADFAPRGALSG